MVPNAFFAPAIARSRSAPVAIATRAISRPFQGFRTGSVFRFPWQGAVEHTAGSLPFWSVMNEQRAKSKSSTRAKSKLLPLLFALCPLRFALCPLLRLVGRFGPCPRHSIWFALSPTLSTGISSRTRSWPRRWGWFATISDSRGPRSGAGRRAEPRSSASPLRAAVLLSNISSTRRRTPTWSAFRSCTRGTGSARWSWCRTGTANCLTGISSYLSPRSWPRSSTPCCSPRILPPKSRPAPVSCRSSAASRASSSTACRSDSM